jgi:hypothetical protein
MLVARSSLGRLWRFAGCMHSVPTSRRMMSSSVAEVDPIACALTPGMGLLETIPDFQQFRENSVQGRYAQAESDLQRLDLLVDANVFGAAMTSPLKKCVEWSRAGLRARQGRVQEEIALRGNVLGDMRRHEGCDVDRDAALVNEWAFGYVKLNAPSVMQLGLSHPVSHNPTTQLPAHILGLLHHQKRCNFDTEDACRVDKQPMIDQVHHEFGMNVYEQLGDEEEPQVKAAPEQNVYHALFDAPLHKARSLVLQGLSHRDVPTAQHCFEQSEQLFQELQAPGPLGLALMEQGVLTENADMLERAVKLLTEAFGAESPIVAECLVEMARWYQYSAGDPVYAEGLFRSSIAKLDACPPGEAYRVEQAKVDAYLAYADLLAKVSFNQTSRQREADGFTAKADELVRQSVFPYVSTSSPMRVYMFEWFNPL